MRPLPSPIEACAAIATLRGTMRTLAQDADARERAGEVLSVDSEAPARDGGAVEHEGFNLHASVRIAAEDDCGRERLCRYGARPPFSLERLRRLPGGRVAYRVKKLGAGRAKHREMTPLELLARLAALVPPPRYPLTRFHGVQPSFDAAGRTEIVRSPTDPGDDRPRSPQRGKGRKQGMDRGPSTGGSASTGQGETSSALTNRFHASLRTAPTNRIGGHLHPHGPSRTPRISLLPSKLERGSRAEPTPGDVSAGIATLVANILSVRHWSRLLGGLLYATSPHLRWPKSPPEDNL